MDIKYLIPIVLLCSVLIFTTDIHKAFAASLTFFDNGTSSDAITRIGSKLGVSNFSANTVVIRSATSPSTTLGTIAITGDGDVYELAPFGDRLYGMGSASLFELDVVNFAVLRTVTHGCTITEGTFMDSVNGFAYCTTTSETVVKMSMSSMTTVFTSTTLNTGANPCVIVEDLHYNSATDTMFASCTSTAKVVAVVGFLTSGTPDFAAVATGSPSDVVFNNNANDILVCKSSGQPQLFDYTPNTSIVLNQALDTTSETCANPENNSLVYHSASDRYFYMTSNDKVIVRDGTTAALLFTTSWTGGGSEKQLFVHNNDLAYLANVVDTAGTDFAVFDTTGINLGSGGEEEPSDTTGIDCDLPENANILICRIGGDGSIGSAGNLIVGNTTDGTGLAGMICNMGFVDCVANPDMKTNGVGYLLVAMALAVGIGILWVASKGQLQDVPTFIWFIYTIAIVGGFTLLNLIDPTFLVVTIIFITALAAAKARGVFGGGDFL